MGRNIDSATTAVLLVFTAFLLSFMKSIAIKARDQVEFWREAVWSSVYNVLAEPEHLIAAQE
jgi:hypothetical protein